MSRYTVKVSKLNVRKRIPVVWPDDEGIIGTINYGTAINADPVPNDEILHDGAGGWFKDAQGKYYWAGGLMATGEPLSSVTVATSAPAVAITGKKDWGFIDFKIDELWARSKGKGATVAILDSGLNYDLNDFKGKTNITYYNAFSRSSNKADCIENSEGHGTDCAGILGAVGNTLFGVAPEADLLIIRITDSNGERQTEAILEGLKYATNAGVDVINMSFYIPPDDKNFDKIHNCIITAYNKGIAILAAAGDSGGLNFPVNNFPASFDECISVGGVDKQMQRSRYSTKSDFLNIMGPGEDMLSVNAPQNPLNGSSFAAPFVAGVIAILKAVAKPKGVLLDNKKLFYILEKSANQNTPDPYNTVDYGWGIINPPEALNLLP